MFKKSFNHIFVAMRINLKRRNYKRKKKTLQVHLILKEKKNQLLNNFQKINFLFYYLSENPLKKSFVLKIKLM